VHKGRIGYVIFDTHPVRWTAGHSGWPAATILGLLYVLQAWGITVDFTAMALLKGHYENPLANMLLIGVFAAIAALRIVQSQLEVRRKAGSRRLVYKRGGRKHARRGKVTGT
jgi:hypothetical protein